MKGRVGVDAHPLNPKCKERTGKESSRWKEHSKVATRPKVPKSKRGTGGIACQSRGEEEGDKMRRAGKKGTGERVRKSGEEVSEAPHLEHLQGGPL